MFYEKKVRYLDFYRNGERVRNGGFARTEIRGERFRLELTLKGVSAAGRTAGSVILCAGEKELLLGEMGIQNGCGEFRYEEDLKKGIDGEELEYGELTGIRIPLGEGMEAACRWPAEKGTDAEEGKISVGKETTARGLFRRKEEKETVSGMALQRGEKEAASGGFRQRGEEGAGSGVFLTREEKETAPESLMQRREKETAPETFMQSGEKEAVSESFMQREEKGTNPETYTQRREKETIQGAVSQSSRRSGTETEENYTRQRMGEGQEVSRAGNISKKNGRTVKLLEEKWLQLSQIYPHIRPFRDERDYLSIGPSDFVIFSEESYRAVNNSFLLHGYYNYHHLILTRMERRGEILYYAGVPGNYYDREKQVAVMFGFESFECAEEPAQQGDFGYYMMRVKV